MLRSFGHRVVTCWLLFSHPKRRNRVAKRTQHVAPDNIAICRGRQTPKKCTKNYNARAQPLFCSLNLLFGDVPVAVAVVICLSSLLSLLLWSIKAVTISTFQCSVCFLSEHPPRPSASVDNTPRPAEFFISYSASFNNC